MHHWLQLDIKDKPLLKEGDDAQGNQPFNWLLDNNPLLHDIAPEKIDPHQGAEKIIPIRYLKIAADSAGYLLEQDGKTMPLHHGDILETDQHHIHVHFITPSKERMPEVMLQHSALSAPIMHAPTTLTPSSRQHNRLPESHLNNTYDDRHSQASTQHNVLLPMDVSVQSQVSTDPLNFLNGGQSTIENHSHRAMSFQAPTQKKHQDSFVPTRSAFSAPVYQDPQRTNHPSELGRHTQAKGLLSDLPQMNRQTQAVQDRFAQMDHTATNFSAPQSPLENIDDLFQSQFEPSSATIAEPPVKKTSFMLRMKNKFQSNSKEL